MFIYKNVDEQICWLNKRLTYVAGSLLFAMLGLSGAHAQNSSSLDEIIVTATKRSASLQDVGVSVSALGTEQINRINPADSTELFQSVPSLELRSNAGSTNANIFLRGVGSTGISFNLQSGVGSYADEVVLNSPVVNILQVYDLERVEVLRGPQNTLYGRNTTGGAINYISKKPEIGGNTNGYVQATIGEYSQLDMNAAIGVPLGDKAAIRLAIQSQERDGIRENLTTGNDDVDRDKFAGRVQLAFEPNDSTSIILKAHAEEVNGGNLRYKSIGGFSPVDGTSPCASPDSLGACVDANGFRDSSDPEQVSNDMVNALNDVESGGASMTVDIDFENFSVRSITAIEENEQVLSEDTDGSPAPAFHFFLDNEQEQFSQEIRLTSNSDQSMRWIVGAYYFKEELSGATGPLFATPMGTMLVQSFADLDNTTYSAYGEMEYDTSDELTFKMGLRYSEDEIEGTTAALLAFENRLPGHDITSSLTNGTPLPSFQALRDTAVTNGIQVNTGGAVGGGPNRLIELGGPNDPDANLNGTSFDNWGGKLGVDWKPAEDTLIYAQWSKGFKAGRFNAAAMSIMNLDANTGRSFGDTPIKEEEVDTYEVGFKTEFADSKARLNAALFFSDYQNQQINVFSGGAFTVVNANSEIYGGEVELNTILGNGYFLDFGASFLDTEVENPENLNTIGGELIMAPNFTFNYALRKEMDLTNGQLLSFTLDGNYSGKRFFDLANTAEDEDYFISNAQISYLFGGDNQHQVTLWGKNILDEEYFIQRFTNTVGLGTDTVLLNEPATFGITLRTNF